MCLEGRCIEVLLLCSRSMMMPLLASFMTEKLKKGTVAAAAAAAAAAAVCAEACASVCCALLEVPGAEAMSVETSACALNGMSCFA